MAFDFGISYIFCRGENFRKQYSQLGDVRSFIPENGPIMALTATATKGTCKAIINAFKMIEPAVVATSPNKPNIKYSVKFKKMSLEETFAPLVERLSGKEEDESNCNILPYL